MDLNKTYIHTYILLVPGILYTLMVLAGIGLAGAVPLLFELVCEATYPIAEGLTNSLMTSLNNLAGLLFLLVLMIPMSKYKQ